MEYIYLLFNEHIPNLVKFGFSTRNPRDRAAELSAPTGVPGRWDVLHYWEVEDGRGVEQAVFQSLSEFRLSNQEFFRLAPEEAVRLISERIRQIGTNPTEKAKIEAEKRRQTESLEERRRFARIRELEQMIENVGGEIARRQQSIRNNIESGEKTGMAIAFVGALVVLAASFSSINSEKGFMPAAICSAFFAIVSFPILYILILGFEKSKHHEKLEAIEKQVCAEMGIASIHDLERRISNLRYYHKECDY
ncbi:MAG: GIY-YIG nuclease family protein [Verrucomicrobia bacterium]|nr:GIY-YIG nuclease family protein [Verrucomicrobiota bacterium]